jgi:hypothetical protein
MALTKASFSMINGAYYNVLDYGAVGDGTTDSTAAIQAAIEAAQASAKPVYIPAGNYLVTDTLTVYNGTQITGDTNFSYGAGYARPVYATTITFSPTSSKDLFNYAWKGSGPGRIFHTSIENLYMTGNANASKGLKLNGVIYAKFANLTFEGFSVGVYCDATINNRYENIFISDATYVGVQYAGNAETTDTWEQCTFFGCPVGVRFDAASIAVRFNSCLWEQITYYGIDVSSRSQSIMVSNAYCEDVPYGSSPAADGCMFRVGKTTGDTVADIQNHLIVIGGEFNGRNAGIAGAGLFNVGVCWGIYAGGFVANRWPYILKTTSDTQLNSVVFGGYQGISWTNNIYDSTKVSGFFPNGVLNSGVFSESARFSTIEATYSVTSGANGYYNYGSVAWISATGSPEGAITAVIGSLYSRTDGGAGTSLYVKESGTGNTGWVAK